jgi:hypothetical protein
MESFDNRFTSQVDFNSEEDNETESENEMLCTPKPKRLRKSITKESCEYY